MCFVESILDTFLQENDHCDGYWSALHTDGTPYSMLEVDMLVIID